MKRARIAINILATLNIATFSDLITQNSPLKDVIPTPMSALCAHNQEPRKSSLVRKAIQHEVFTGFKKFKDILVKKNCSR